VLFLDFFSEREKIHQKRFLNNKIFGKIFSFFFFLLVLLLFIFVQKTLKPKILEAFKKKYSFNKNFENLQIESVSFK
jgi:hypothetical protein